MIRVLAFFLAFIASISFAALQTDFEKKFEGYVEVSAQDTNRKVNLFVRYKPAASGQATLVILNGLTHTTSNWNMLLREIELSDFGVLQVDLAGQGRTLSKQGPMTEVIRYQDQVHYLAKVLAKLDISSRISILGLSYGGGIATAFAAKYPALVERLILMAPYIEPQPEQEKWIRDQIAAIRIAFPSNPASDEELYDYFLRQLVYSTYPIAEPDIMTVPFKLEAAFRLAQGIRKLHTINLISHLPPRSVHLIVAADDLVVKPARLEKFWVALGNSTQSSRLIMKDTAHNIIQLQPKLAAVWLKLILNNDPRTTSGQTFLGDPHTETFAKH